MSLSNLTPASSIPIATNTPSQNAKLTPVQQTAVAHLHAAAEQFEGIFVGMMMKEMRSSVGDDSMFGKSPATDMFNSMLDDQRAQNMSQSGALGIGKLVEAQLRSTVIGNATHEAKVGVPTGGF